MTKRIINVILNIFSSFDKIINVILSIFRWFFFFCKKKDKVHEYNILIQNWGFTKVQNNQKVRLVHLCFIYILFQNMRGNKDLKHHTLV